MKLTRAGDYGIQGMLHLASLPKGQDAFVAEIAKRCDIPSSFLAKIFQSLSRAGLVRSQRGVKGGFILTRPADQITILDIIESVEGPINLNRCLRDEKACSKHNQCAAYNVFEEAQMKLMEVFEKYSLIELVNKGDKFSCITSRWNSMIELPVHVSGQRCELLHCPERLRP